MAPTNETRRERIEHLVDTVPMPDNAYGGMKRTFMIEKIEWLMDAHGLEECDLDLADLAALAFDLRMQIMRLRQLKNIRIDRQQLLSLNRPGVEIEPPPGTILFPGPRQGG